MQMDSSARRTGSDSLSAVEWAITVWIPISRQVRMTRRAISPRFAMRILWNTRARSGLRVDEEERLAELDGLAIVHQDPGDAPGHLGLNLIHELHRLDDAEHLPVLHHVALLDIGRGIGGGGAVEGAHHGRLHLHEVRRQRRLRHWNDLRRSGRRALDARSRRGHRAPLAHHADAGAPLLDSQLGEVVLDRELNQLGHGGPRRVRRGNLPAGLAGCHGRYRAAATRPRYSPLRVSTLITSPSLRKSGTCTTAPVSSVAGLEPPDAVSPRMPGSVLTICRSRKLGSSTVAGLPSIKSISTSVLSLR